MDSIKKLLGEKFGILAESNTQELTVVAKNEDVAVGDLFVLPSNRGHERFYIFRTSEYANIMNRTIQLGDVARNKLTMADSYMSDDLVDEKLIELHGNVLGYSEKEGDVWTFHRPRRLPEHLSDVYLITESNSEAIKILLGSQLGTEGVIVGNLLAGENPLSNVPVYLPPFAISHHIAIFGRTGCGKSNTMMVLIESMFRNNERVLATGRGQKVSMLAIDPHDEFFDWHRKSGGRGGLSEIVGHYSPDQRKALVEPFYYLTPKHIEERDGVARVRFSRADVVPEDVISIMDFSDQQSQVAHLMYNLNGEMWISKLLSGDLGEDPSLEQYLDSTKSAVERRVSFLRADQTSVFTAFDPDMGLEYDSMLPESHRRRNSCHRQSSAVRPSTVRFILSEFLKGVNPAMTIVPYVCAEFHDRTGAVLYSVKSRQLGTMIFDAPDSIRQDPLFGMLVADGSFRIPQNEKEKKLLENEPYQKAPGKVEEERSSPAPAEGKPSGRKTAEKKA